MFSLRYVCGKMARWRENEKSVSFGINVEDGLEDGLEEGITETCFHQIAGSQWFGGWIGGVDSRNLFPSNSWELMVWRMDWRRG